MNIKIKSAILSSLFISVMMTSSTFTYAAEEMTDAERAVAFQQKEEEIKRLKAQHGISDDSVTEKQSKKSYKIPQRREESSRVTSLGKRDVYSNDLKKESEERNSYKYSGIKDRREYSSKTSSKNPLKYKRKSGVVGNTKLQTTRINTKKIKTKLGSGSLR